MYTHTHTSMMYDIDVSNNTNYTIAIANNIASKKNNCDAVHNFISNFCYFYDDDVKCAIMFNHDSVHNNCGVFCAMYAETCKVVIKSMFYLRYCVWRKVRVRGACASKQVCDGYMLFGGQLQNYYPLSVVVVAANEYVYAYDAVCNNNINNVKCFRPFFYNVFATTATTTTMATTTAIEGYVVIVNVTNNDNDNGKYLNDRFPNMCQYILNQTIQWQSALVDPVGCEILWLLRLLDNGRMIITDELIICGQTQMPFDKKFDVCVTHPPLPMGNKVSCFYRLSNIV